MSSMLQFEVCSETGICSILRSKTEKIDLLSDEVDAIRAASGDTQRIKALLAENDSSFAASLTSEELTHIGQRLS